MDGGFTNNLPVIDKNTIRISPFAGKAKDIAPIDHVKNRVVKIANEDVEVSTRKVLRGLPAMTAISDKKMDALYKEGYLSTENFLQNLLH